MSANGTGVERQLVIPEHIALLWEQRHEDIVRLGHPALRATARPVGRPSFATRSLVERMKAAMAAEHGIGLAAPQVGVSQRVIIYRLPEENAPTRVIVDPRIVKARGSQVAEEGCLSIPYLHGEVVRAQEIIVKGLDLRGNPVRRRATDLEARVIQHEVDHLDGILFIDRADPATLHWSLPESVLAEPESVSAD